MTRDRNTPFAPVLRFIPGDVPKWAEAAFEAFSDPLPCPVLVWYDLDGRHPNPRLRLASECEAIFPGADNLLMDDHPILNMSYGGMVQVMNSPSARQAALPWDDQLVTHSLSLAVIGLGALTQDTGMIMARTLAVDAFNIDCGATEKVNSSLFTLGHELGHVRLFGRLGQGFTGMEHELQADLHAEEGCFRIGDQRTPHVHSALLTVGTFTDSVNYDNFSYWFDRSGSQPQAGVQAGAGLLELKLRAASLWEDKFADQTPGDFVLSVMGPRDGPSGTAARLFDRSRSTADLLRRLKPRTQGRDLAFATPERVDHILDAAQRLFTRRFLKDLSIAPPHRSFAPALS